MFILRTTQPPSTQKLLELERIVIVDEAGVNVSAGSGAVRACLVGEFPQGPFGPTVVRSSGDTQNLYIGANPNKFTLISQGSFNPAGSGVDTDGSGVTFDGNGWAELKGKTFSGLVIQRVDCDAVAADSSVVKSYVAFTVTVDTTDYTTISGVNYTNKDIVIPSGTRFAETTIGSATVVLALSQQITIPAGSVVTGGGEIVCGINFTQDAATGMLTYVATGGTTGATAFFVKGTTAAIAVIDTVIDAAIPNVASVIKATGISTIGPTGSAAAVFAPAGGGAAPSPDTLSNRIVANYAAAIDKTLPGQAATNDIAGIWSARNYHCTVTSAMSNLRKKLWTANAVAASTTGRGRVACVTAAPCTDLTPTVALSTTLALYTAQLSTDSVVGPDADRYWLSGPYVQVFSQELNADITISSCGFRAAQKVNLFNDGRSEYLTSCGVPFNATIQQVDAQEPGFAANPLPDDTYYRDLKAAGVAWFVQDRTAGWWFYSGVTGASPVLYANRVDDNRRSFADEVEDQILALASRYSKLPGTTERQDAFTSDMRAYLDGMVNPPPGVNKRARQYQVLDGAKAGNTDTLNGQGIYLFSASVVMFGSMKTIMITAAIGATVVITQVS
jgi:hypothetical protein